MSWDKDYREASFRGEKFWVTDVTAQIGRKTVVHEMPGDYDHVEDVGRKGRKFALEAHVIGPNYAALRDRLRDAFELPGSGVLVHPFWGELTVTVVGEVSVKESTRQGGMVLFSLSVIEQGDMLLVAVDKTVAKKAAVVAKLAADAFKKDFNLAGFIAALIAKVLGKISAILTAIAKVKGFVDQILGIVDEVVNLVDQIMDTLEMLIGLPEMVGQSIYGAWQSVVASVTRFMPEDTKDKERVVEALMAILAVAWECTESLVDAPTTTPTRLRQRAAEQALRTHTRASTISLVAAALEEIEFTSAAQTERLQAELLDKLDSLVEEPDLEHEQYEALEDLRSSIVQYLEATTLQLPSVTSYAPAISLPALVVAHNIYGDATRAAEVVERNRVVNENQLIGGVELEVLHG